jgi:hypothetical protein
VARILKFSRFFFAQLRQAEAGYNGSEDSESDGNNEDATERNEWYLWTKIVVQVAEDMRVSIKEVTKQPYVTTLFWLHFFNEKRKEQLNENV